MKGYINEQYPNAKTNYDDAMQALRSSYKKPVFGFEVGQFEVLPDFDELNDFGGISDPVNYRVILERVKEKGLLTEWKSYVEATGELSRLCYKEEVEAVLRTKEMSGISLLGLQDFPGQGTALVGMMNSHLHSKPYAFAEPSAFQTFFKDSLPLLQLDRYTYEEEEEVNCPVLFANYSKCDVNTIPKYEVTGDTFRLNGQWDAVQCPTGSLSLIGKLKLQLPSLTKSEKIDITIILGNSRNTYSIWVYKKVIPSCPPSIYQSSFLDQKALDILHNGGKVFLSPDATREALPKSIQAQFSTDFWSVGTFSKQEGGMGQLIDKEHPVFQNFPTESHTNWQWWIIASQRAFILPRKVKTIITEMDSYAYLRPMAQLFECNCLNGKLILSSIGLQNLQQYPEARALLQSIYQYMDSEVFQPKEQMTINEINQLIKA